MMKDKPQRVGENLYRRQSNGIYYAIFAHNGRSRQRSLHTTDRETANNRLRQLLLAERGINGDAALCTLAEWCADWGRRHFPFQKPNTQRRYRAVFDNFGAAMPVRLRDLTPMLIERWAADRLTTAKPATYNLERMALVGVLNDAVRHGALTRNPAAGLQRAKILKACLTLPNAASLRVCFESIRVSGREREADFLCFLQWTGLRLAEALAVDWADVTDDGIRVRVGDNGPKNHRERVVPLLPQVRSILDRQPKLTPKIWAGLEAGVNSALAAGCRANGLPRLTHHSLRHWFISEALRRGVDVLTVAGWVGHSDNGALILRTYGHLIGNHRNEMAARMGVDNAD